MQIVCYWNICSYEFMFDFVTWKVDYFQIYIFVDQESLFLVLNSNLNRSVESFIKRWSSLQMFTVFSNVFATNSREFRFFLWDQTNSVTSIQCLIKFSSFTISKKWIKSIYRKTCMQRVIQHCIICDCLCLFIYIVPILVHVNCAWALINVQHSFSIQLRFNHVVCASQNKQHRNSSLKIQNINIFKFKNTWIKLKK